MLGTMNYKRRMKNRATAAWLWQKVQRVAERAAWLAKQTQPEVSR